ncbi:MAG: aldehyde dehydrogenase family protein [Anaerolineales bacterium]|nr:aldehyde dehydrogenase family protein [Anaerolineales bacterium]
MSANSVPSLEQRLRAAFPARDEVPAGVRPDPSAYERLYLLDGKVRAWEGEVSEVRSPVCLRADGKLERALIGHAPVMDDAAVMAAVDAAARAWDGGHGTWPTMSVSGRIGSVEKFLALMLPARDEVVRLLMWEIGKSLEDSQKEFDRTVEYIRRTVEALKELDRASSRFALDAGIIAQIRRSPLGVCLSMGPFNYPLNETYTTLLPALVMGNTAVVKPAKFGTLVHQPLLRAFAESFPPGVVNFIYGRGGRIIEPLLRSGKIDVLAFIGTSKVADLLKQQHPRPHRMRAVLGLDAKNPALIMPDADLENAVKESVLGALSFNGQRCTALKIFFVHESIADDFLARLSEAVNALPFGMPWLPKVRITPLPEPDKAVQMKAYLDDAAAKGARVVNAGGGTACESLFFPAVVHPIPADAGLYHEEQFGPVIPVCSYREEREFFDFVTRSNYGQQASLFGNDPARIGALIDKLANQVCRINLNSQCQRGPDSLPFTGRKDSAEMTLSITDALRAFSIRTLVAASSNPANRELIQNIVNGRKSSFLNTDFIL